MKVALVHPFAWPEVMRGGERYLHDLAWYLRCAGHDVEVVTGTNGSPGVDEIDGVPIHRYRHRRNRRLTQRGIDAADTFGVAAFAHLVRHRYDLVHALMPTAAIAARASGHRTIYTDIGHPDRDDMRMRPGSWPLFVAAVRSANRVTALSHSAARAVTQLTGVVAMGLQPGVRLDRFEPVLTPRSGSPVLLFNSDLSERRKGLDHLVAAFARVLQRRPDARLVLAAPGDHRWALEGLGPAKAAVEAATDVIGPVPPHALQEYYGRATVTLLPSKFEAFGLVLVESLACGTPVVSTDWGGPTEIVERDDVGALVPYGDVDALAAAVHRVVELAARPDTPQTCVDHARGWDWAHAVGPAHETLYASVAKSRA